MNIKIIKTIGLISFFIGGILFGILLGKEIPLHDVPPTAKVEDLK